jgi:carboxyl-terminal processing protease
VTLTLEREGAASPLDVTLVREIIKIQSTKHKVLENGIGYVRLRSSRNKQVRTWTKPSIAYGNRRCNR